jgi:hypothetical protein
MSAGEYDREAIVEGMKKVMKDVEAVADLSNTAQRPDREEPIEQGAGPDREKEDGCGDQVDEGKAEGPDPGNVRLSGEALVKKGSRADPDRYKKQQRQEQKRSRETKERFCLWPAKNKSQKSSEEKSVDAELGSEVESVGGDPSTWKQKAGSKPGERHENDDRGAQVEKAYAIAKKKDGEGPCEVELLFDAERPEVSEAEIKAGEAGVKLLEGTECGERNVGDKEVAVVSYVDEP